MEKTETKVCTKCGVEKLMLAFSRDKSRKDGRNLVCKECEAARFRQYREENKEKVAAIQRRYREENKEKVAAMERRYREENKEKVAARERRYREEKKEKVAARHRRYREENKEKVAARERRYREENKEKVAAIQRRYREAIPSAYIKKILRIKPTTPISPALIEAKRFQLRILRELKKD